MQERHGHTGVSAVKATKMSKGLQTVLRERETQPGTLQPEKRGLGLDFVNVYR